MNLRWHCRTWTRGLAAVLVALGIGTGSAIACIWDRDTVAAEARGLPGVVEVLSGRFERMPPEFHRARLERVTRALAADPTRLDLYDDAAAAADRLRQGDLAVAWMVRKKDRLDALGAAAPAEHRYRHHANLGTFLAHRWLRAGAPRESLDDLHQARQHIARAIDIDANAHFGRERYQLMAIDWLLAAPVASQTEDWASATLFWAAAPAGSTLRQSGFVWPGVLERAGFQDAVQGLSGLIVLGDAWESVDVHLALGVALDSAGHAGLAFMARLRVEELIAAGRRSANPGLDSARLQQMLERMGHTHVAHQATRLVFADARREADAWQSQRWQTVRQQLAVGTLSDPDLQGLARGLGTTGIPPPPSGRRPLVVWAAAVLVLMGVAWLGWRWRRRGHRRAASAS